MPPARLLWRLWLAALGVGAVGGAVTALLALVFAASDASLVAWLLAFEVPILLAGMIVHRLAAPPAPSGRRMVWTAMVGALLMVAAQVVPQGLVRVDDVPYVRATGGIGEFVTGVGPDVPAALLIGALAGVVTATAALGVLALLLVLLRTNGVTMGSPATATLVTAVTSIVATASALLVAGPWTPGR